MRVAAKTDTGRCRANNEDSFLVDQRIGLLVVADGMGGHAGGSLASRLAVKSIGSFINSHLANNGQRDSGALLKGALEAANQTIAQSAVEDVALREMASTTVVALCSDSQIHLAHLGDSRAYLIRQPNMVLRLTEDHSLVQEMLNSGHLTNSQAKNHRLSHVVTRCLGGGGQFEPTIKTVTCQPGDYLLLCSDGLTKMVEEDQIVRAVLRDRDDVNRACKRLIELANKHGGKDNITVILARF